MTAPNRKQIIREYKEAELSAGVFQIRNKINQKVFVKSTMDMQTINGQRFQLKMGSHMNKALQEEWNRYGEEAFIFEILETLDNPAEIHDPRDAVKKLEAKWMDKLHPYGERGYHRPPE